MKTTLIRMSFGLLLMAGISLSSCSKNDNDPISDPGDGNKIKSARITLTVTGGNSKSIDISAGGVNTAGETNIFKVDGSGPGNDALVTFDEKDFPGTGSTTHTLDLDKPVNNLSLNIYAGVLSGTSSYKLYYKVVVNGTTREEVTTDIVAGTDYSKFLRYTE